MLCEDVLHTVFSHIAPYRNHERLFQIDNILTSAARVCHTWSVPAQALLYRELVVDTQPDGTPSPSLPLLARTMRTSPHLRALVRSLKLITPRPLPEEHIDWLALFPTHAIPACVYTWNMHPQRDIEIFSPALLQTPALKSVRRLSMSGPHTSNSIRAALALPLLETLQLEYDYRSRTACDVRCGVPPRLRRVVITTGVRDDRAPYALLKLLAAAPQVEEIIVRILPCSSGEADWRALADALAVTTARLRRLEIWTGLELWEAPGLEPFMDELVVRSPKLEVVRCVQGTFTETFFGRLPDGLRTMVLAIPHRDRFPEVCADALVECVRLARDRGLGLERVEIWPIEEEDALATRVAEAARESGIATE